MSILNQLHYVMQLDQKVNLMINQSLIQIAQRMIEVQLDKQVQLMNQLVTCEKNRCLARIHNGTQCSRKYKPGDKPFCGSHLATIPYGRIDDQKTPCKKSAKKPPISRDPHQVDYRHYIKTSIINIGGTEYLIDDHGVIYENNNDNTIVARKLNENEYQWFN